jgi:hypothetical protein
MSLAWCGLLYSGADLLLQRSCAGCMCHCTVMRNWHTRVTPATAPLFNTHASTTTATSALEGHPVQPAVSCYQMGHAADAVVPSSTVQAQHYAKARWGAARSTQAHAAGSTHRVPGDKSHCYHAAALHPPCAVGTQQRCLQVCTLTAVIIT